MAVAASDVGRRRRRNEDACALLPPYGIAVVADGMGGHAAGDIASRMAVECVCEFLRAQAPAQRGQRSAERAVASAIEYANDAIYAEARRAGNDMGTTVVVLLAVPGAVWIGHVGDSRAYLFHGATSLLERVTEDHNQAAMLRDRGVRDPEVLAAFGHVLARALGIGPTVDVDLRQVHPEPGDLLLLATDGLTGPVEDAAIGSTLQAHGHDMEACARALVDAANDRGGPDNVTVALVRVE